MKSKKIMHDIFQNLEIGIGEVSKLTGVSQRHLRYWETKGYIKPISDDQSGVRRYNLATLYLIVFITEQLDEGCTLSAAFEHSKDIRLKSRIVHQFFRETFDDVKVTDSTKGYGKIDLGEFQAEDGSMHHFKGVVDEKGQYVRMDE